MFGCAELPSNSTVPFPPPWQQLYMLGLLKRYHVCIVQFMRARCRQAGRPLPLQEQGASEAQGQCMHMGTGKHAAAVPVAECGLCYSGGSGAMVRVPMPAHPECPAAMPFDQLGQRGAWSCPALMRKGMPYQGGRGETGDTRLDADDDGPPDDRPVLFTVPREPPPREPPPPPPPVNQRETIESSIQVGIVTSWKHDR